jgi:hypothetical protein
MKGLVVVVDMESKESYPYIVLVSNTLWRFNTWEREVFYVIDSMKMMLMAGVRHAEF